MEDNFFIALFETVAKNINNDHKDNYDQLRFGKNLLKERKTLKGVVRNFLNTRGYFSGINSESLTRFSKFKWIKDFEYLYHLLGEEANKELLLEIISYRILGHKKVKLPLNTPEYWDQIKLIQRNEDRENFIQIKFMDFKLFYNDLNYLGIPIKLYFATEGIHVDFIIKQYEFKNKNVHIKASENDIIIDGGGCFGDTALYFSNLTGKSGEVHSFEFIPDNIEIWRKNISLNPNLKSAITLVDQPLWSSSDVNIFYKSNGPGSIVKFEKFDESDGDVRTISIDDYAKMNQLRSVDFIKLDIEGAELNALKGSIATLKKFKPKLAVALYHNTEDFHTIPKFLNELGLGYKFYLSHATIHSEETMLFAIVPND